MNMGKEDMEMLDRIAGFDPEKYSPEAWEFFMEAVNHFAEYRVEKKMLPPLGTGERRCPRCREQIIWPVKFCQHCGQKIVDPNQAANKARIVKMKETRWNHGMD